MLSVNDIAGLRKGVKYAYVDATGSGNTAVVAAVSGYKIRVLAVAAHAITAVTIHFESATTQISADVAAGATGGYVRPGFEYGWFETAASVALNVNLSGAVATGVDVVYELVAV
jgi:hypothetical protein